MKLKQTLKRIASVTILLFALPLIAETTMAQSSGFSDVPSTNPYYTAIMDLQARGIISGYPDGTYKPDQVVNRVEALKIILLGSSIDVPDTTGTGGFSDTSATDWYAKYLLKAKELGIVSGYPDGTFKPAQTVNLVENLKMLINTLNIDLLKTNVTSDPYADAFMDQWYAKYVEYAKELQWISADGQNMIYPDQGMTRGKLAQLLYNSIHNNTAPTTQTQIQTEQQTQQPTQQIWNTSDALIVNIENSTYNKDNMTVPLGAKVLWMNKDSVAHTVTSDDGTSFDSESIQPGQSFEYTFNTLGTYSYHSTLQPSMKGSIIVKPAIEVPTI